MVDSFVPKYGMPGEDGANGSFNQAVRQIVAHDPMRLSPGGHRPSRIHGYLCGCLTRGEEAWRRALETLEQARALTYPVELIYPEKWTGPRPQTTFACFEEYEAVFVAPILRDIEGLRGVLAAEVAGEITPEEADRQAERILMTNGGDRRSPRFQSDNYQTEKRWGRYGTGDAYLEARLRRDHLAIHARLLAGEFRSVRAAAIAAGIITPKPVMTVPRPIPEMAAALRRRLSQTELRDLIAALTDHA